MRPDNNFFKIGEIGALEEKGATILCQIKRKKGATVFLETPHGTNIPLSLAFMALYWRPELTLAEQQYYEDLLKDAAEMKQRLGDSTAK